MFALSPKMIITIAIIIVLIIVVICVVRGVKGFEARKGARKENRAVDQELKDLEKSGNGPTISSAQAYTYANSLHTAMDGYGTDWASIKSVFEAVRNNADVISISSAYGIREVSSGQWNPEPNIKGTLTQCLTSELDDSEKEEIKTILKGKGITFQI